MATKNASFGNHEIADCIARVRAARPHVHCITNSVAQHFSANVLLAVGMKASMTIAAEEVAAFVKMADALLINLGTMDDERRAAVDIAVDTVKTDGKPWALDPVFVNASPIRLDLARSVLNAQPSVIRCNEGEGRVLLSVEPNTTELQKAAARYETTIALTGQSDAVCNANGAIRIENGSPLMDRVTAMGCALTALMAGFAAVENNHLLATASAAALFGLAGDVAQANSKGPGTFVPQFLDALHNLEVPEITAGVKLS